MTITIPLKREISTTAVTLLWQKFFPVWDTLTADQKYWLIVKFLQIFFYLQNFPMRLKVSQAQGTVQIFPIIYNKR